MSFRKRNFAIINRHVLNYKSPHCHRGDNNKKNVGNRKHHSSLFSGNVCTSQLCCFPPVYMHVLPAILQPAIELIVDPRILFSKILFCEDSVLLPSPSLGSKCKPYPIPSFHIYFPSFLILVPISDHWKKSV